MMGPNLRDCYHAKHIYVSVLRQNQICFAVRHPEDAGHVQYTEH